MTFQKVTTALLGLAVLFSMNAFAKKDFNPSAEEREKMAVVHEQLATCLRSTKPFDECHKEMEKAHAGHHGMMHGKKKHVEDHEAKPEEDK